MAVEFVTFQKFSDKESAGQLAALLEKHQVECILEDNSSSLDATFGSQAFENNYAVKIRQADFEKVNHILIEDSIADLDAIDKDYYLFSFTDDELRDILAHRDEWNAFDFILAQKLLKRRGSEVSEEQLDDLKQQRIVELSQPEPTQTAWITAGYIMAFMGGLLGIFIGWFLSSHKKTLPNGDRVFNYSNSDRKHGRNIFYLGIFFVIFWNLLWFFGLPFFDGFHH
jgi:hypothetical protein